MKPFRSTAIMVVIVGALVAFTIYDHYRTEKNDQVKKTESEVLHFKSDDFAKLELMNREGTTIDLEKVGDEWSLTAPLKDSADGPTLVNFFNGLQGEKILDTVVEGKEIGWTTFHLDKPVATLVLTAKDGRTEKIEIGGKAYDGSVYGRIDGASKVLLLGAPWYVYTNKGVKDFRDRRMFRQALSTRFDGFRVTHVENGKSAVFELKSQTDKDGKQTWSVQKGEANPISNAAVEEFMSQVRALRAFDFLPGESTDSKAVAEYGLDHPRLILELWNSKDPKSNFSLKVANNKDKKSNQNAITSDISTLVSVYKSAITPVDKHLEDFMDKRAPFQFAKDNVASIRYQEIKPSAKSISLHKKAGHWEIDGDANTKPSDAKVEELLTRAEGLEVARFLDASTKVSKPTSTLKLMDASGKTLLELSWGDPVTLPETERRAEMTVLPVHSNLSKRVSGVAPLTLRALDFTSVRVPEATPTISPAPSSHSPTPGATP